ncbi:MAG TPA: hypothetical protein V6C65_33180, partial [Allocoleopsis sp.]
MARVYWKHAVVVGAVSLLALVGCSKGNEATVSDASSSPAITSSPATTTTTSEASPSPDSTMNQTASNSTTTGQPTNKEFDGLLEVVSNTKADVESGDFAKAQTDFNNFETYWSQVEDGVKTKSSDSYDAIESSMDAISGELSASQPNKDKVLTELQNLEKTVNSVKP